jgi:glycosyltransferase involved in cell wall biosynthesis
LTPALLPAQTLPVRLALLHPRLDWTDGTARLVAAVRAARVAGHEVHVLSRPGSREGAVRAAGARVHHGELPEHPVAGFFALRRAREEVRRLAPELLVATDGRLAPLLARTADALELPCVLELVRPPEAPLELSRHARAVVVPWEALVERAVNAGEVPRALLRVVEHGPDPREPWVPPPLLEDRPPVLVAAGTLDRDHGFDVLVEAVRLFTRGGRRLHALVVGEGPEEDALRRQVREARLGDSITIQCADVPGAREVLTQADLFVAPTRAGDPGWTAVEALALGVPSILAATSCTVGLLDDRREGLLIQRNDPAKLAESIGMLLDNPAFARRLGALARARLIAEHRAEGWSAAVTSLLAEAAEPTGAR